MALSLNLARTTTSTAWLVRVSPVLCASHVTCRSFFVYITVSLDFCVYPRLRYFSGNFEHYMKDSMNYASATKLLFPDNDHFHFGVNVNDLKEGTSIFELLANFVNGKVQGPGAPKSATAAAVAPLNAGKEIDFHKNRIAVKMDSLVMDMYGHFGDAS